jgi:hypothetical protein
MAMALPIPVDEAVIMATFPFIFCYDKWYYNKSLFKKYEKKIYLYKIKKIIQIITNKVIKIW